MAKFDVALRGYDREAVQKMVARADEAIASNDDALRAAVLAELGSVTFPVSLRGYNRLQVDSYLRLLAARLA